MVRAEWLKIRQEFWMFCKRKKNVRNDVIAVVVNCSSAPSLASTHPVPLGDDVDTGSN